MWEKNESGAGAGISSEGSQILFFQALWGKIFFKQSMCCREFSRRDYMERKQGDGIKGQLWKTDEAGCLLEK